MPEVHARLSASGAKRWMACPRSVALEETLPETESEYAKEGTEAHSWAERILNAHVNNDLEEVKRLEAKLIELNPEMHANVIEYVSTCLEVQEEGILKNGWAMLLVEQRVDFSRYVPGGFGTTDCTVITEGHMTVLDLKYGKGVKVDAPENPQPRLYALGNLEEWDWLYDIKTVNTMIVQPRLNHVSTESLKATDLYRWAEDEVKPKALLASEDKGEYVPGDHCKFCKARKVCKARARHVFQALNSILKN